METQSKKILTSRRELLKLGGLALAGTLVDQAVRPLNVRAAAKTNPRGTARYCIFIEMVGAISPMESWDIKDTQYTPKDLDVRKITSDLYLSHALFPEFSKVADRCSFVRSMRARELIHAIGQYHTQTGRALNLGIAKEVPAFGSVVAVEMESSRRETDTFPGYMSTGLAKSRPGSIGSGFFAPRFAGVDLDPLVAFDSFGGNRGALEAQLSEKYDVLKTLSAATSKQRGELGDKETAYDSFYKTAYTTLRDPRWSKVFQITDEDRKKYGKDNFGLGALLARNLVAADAGTRIVYVNDGLNWDHHAAIFDRTKGSNLYATCATWDPIMAALINDLSSMPGHAPGKTLLDETLVVATSEFGRTPAVNNAFGRDHYNMTYSSLWVGGGVKPGRIIGKTNQDCSKVIDNGWKHKEQPWMDNTAATIYSALGIDFGKSVSNTPSGRDYDYVQSAPLGGADFIAPDAIDELFA